MKHTILTNFKNKLPIATSLVLPVVFAGLTLTSSIAHADKGQGASTRIFTDGGYSIQCVENLDLRPGEVVNGGFISESCSDDPDSTINSVMVGPHNGNGHRVCINFGQLPADYVLTSVWYDPKCGGRVPGPRGDYFYLENYNMGVLYKPYSGITACLHTRIPAGFVAESYYLDSRACGNIQLAIVGNAAVLARADAPVVDTPPDVDSATSGIQMPNDKDWYQIQLQTQGVHVNVWENFAIGQFIELPAGTYDLINLTTGSPDDRKNGIVVGN